MLRAVTLLSKAFLSHFPVLLRLRKPDAHTAAASGSTSTAATSTVTTFGGLWLRTLACLAAHMHAPEAELLGEAVPETLKNMLLVMGEFNPPHPTPALHPHPTLPYTPTRPYPTPPLTHSPPRPHPPSYPTPAHPTRPHSPPPHTPPIHPLIPPSYPPHTPSPPSLHRHLGRL